MTIIVLCVHVPLLAISVKFLCAKSPRASCSFVFMRDE